MHARQGEEVPRDAACLSFPVLQTQTGQTPRSRRGAPTEEVRMSVATVESNERKEEEEEQRLSSPDGESVPVD